MYTIGAFSRINRITPKTLRHYDRIGLLKPAATDEWTGYRYYGAEQLPQIRRILMLKELGFSLAEIQAIVTGEAEMPRRLERRKAELEQELHEQQARLNRVAAYLARIQEGETMTGDVTIKTLPEVIVASMRTTVPSYDTFFEIVPKMGEYMQSVGAVCREPEYCFTIFHNDEYREEGIDVEVCEAVTAVRPDSPQVTFKTIAAVPSAACIIHRGPYRTLGQSYNALFAWIEDEGYEPGESSNSEQQVRRTQRPVSPGTSSARVCSRTIGVPARIVEHSVLSPFDPATTRRAACFEWRQPEEWRTR